MLLISIPIFLLTSLFLYIIYYYKFVSPKKIVGLVDKKTGKFPTYGKTSPSIPLGDIPTVSKKFWTLDSEWYNEQGLYLYWQFANPAVRLTDPELVKYVLNLPDSTWVRDSGSFIILDRIFGKGILGHTGENWQRQHRILTRSFGPKIVKSLTPAMHEIAKTELMDKLQNLCDNEPSVDMMELFRQVTMNVIVRTTIGMNQSKVDQVLTHIFYLVNSMGNPLTFLPYWNKLPLKITKKVNEAFDELDKIIYEAIDNRRREREEMTMEERSELRTLLDMFIEATDNETGAKLTDTEVRDNMLSFFLAGSDTTASSLCWTLIHLSNHPEVVEKFRNEVKSVLKDDNFRPEMMDQLPYVQAVITESLRHTPPVNSVPPRKTTNSIEIGDWIIPSGVNLMVPVASLGNNEKYWNEPLSFNPDRFLTKDNIVPYTNIPFGGGRRTCIGKTFAIQEINVVLIPLIMNFDFVQLSKKYSSPPRCSMFGPFLHPVKEDTQFCVSKHVEEQ